MMAYVAPKNLDKMKIIEMCLIHDLPECIVGDLTPSDNVDKQTKQCLEKVKRIYLFRFLTFQKRSNHNLSPGALRK